jgi:hypothetical protein
LNGQTDAPYRGLERILNQLQQVQPEIAHLGSGRINPGCLPPL